MLGGNSHPGEAMTTTSATPRLSWPANGLGAVFDIAAASHRRAVGILVLASLLLFVPGFFQIPPVDRDEAYFAQATKQMIESGDYVDIRYQDDVRYRKPVGIYWLQAIAVKTAKALHFTDARTTIWLYRVPSLLGAIGAVLMTYWCALAFVSRRGATLAALMMAASAILGVEARLAKTDAVLLFTIIAAIGVLARAYLRPREKASLAVPPLPWTQAAIFWTALAVGILIKGPVNLMIVGLAALTLSIFERSGRWLLGLRPLAGVVWLFLIVLPWFVAIYWRAGDAFFANSVGRDMLGKLASAQETHGAPPGTYFVIFFATFYPASILAGLAAPAVWTVRREPAARFLLAWLVPSWIVFEVVITKLPHYVLPLYPAIAILIAGAVESNVLSRRPWLKRGTAWWFVAPILISITVVVGSVIVARDLGLPAWPFLAGAIVCGLFAWQLYDDDGAERAFMRAAVGMILIALSFYGLMVPWLTPVFPSVALANVLHQANCPHPLAASAGYEEPSLVFLAGTETHMTDASGAADFLRGGACSFAFIDERQERAFALRAESIGLHYTRGPRIEGFNISNGRPIAIAVFATADAP
jgi:4-amino-4-deoxy-L-arabinose transferase-like glycosyltransferase